MNRVIQTGITSATAGLVAFALAHAELSDWGDNYTGAKLSNPKAYAVAPAGVTTIGRQDRAAVAALIRAEADRQAVPHRIALAVAKVESGYRCEAVGPKTRHGRGHGPLQILPKSAERLGFPTTNLASCGNGLAAGMAHLADCYRRAEGDTVRTAACHVGGPGMSSGPRGRYAQKYVFMVSRAMDSL
jgi:hypothetical protein